MEYLSIVPFHLLPTAISIVAILLILRHRQQVGSRRVAFGIAGIALLAFNRIWPAVLSTYISSQSERDFMRAATRQTMIGLVSSVIAAIAVWLIFVAITNRRSSKDV